MKKYLIFLLTIFSFCLFSPNVYAEETEGSSCSGKEINELNKMASKVKAAYEIKQREDGSNYFLISIYNLSDGIAVNMESNYIIDGKRSTSKDKIESVLITFEQSNNGTYTFEVTDTISVIQYTMNVVFTKPGCENGTYKSIKVIKPRYNNMSELDLCKKEEVKDYIYCEKWTTKWFSLRKEEIIDKINKLYNSKTTTTTTKCASCETMKIADAKIKKNKRIKIAIILGIIAGMIVDIFYIGYTIWKMKRYDI